MAAVSVADQTDKQSATINEAWLNLAELQLRLRDSVYLYQHKYRGQPWLIIADQDGENYFRCSANAEPFLKRLDGVLSVEQALSETQLLQSNTLSSEDVVKLVANLQAANLLEDDSPSESLTRNAPNRWLRPFSIKFPLLDPDQWLEKISPYVKPIFSPAGLWIWLVTILTALSLSSLHWAELAEHAQARFDDPANLLWYWLLYPVIKALHELGHACATKVWGGVVHEMGIMLLVFFPVPYVDSSASHRFSSRRRRIMVNAAGIMAETFLASMALLLWVNTAPGLLHDIAFDVAIIGGVSTLLFNANPLLRFDGYYILSELIEIPNMGTRSIQYLGYLIKHYLLNIPAVTTPVTAKGEIKWLFFYGLGSGIYRIFISLFIASWVAGKFFILGVLLAIWALITQLAYPAVKQLYELIKLCQVTDKLNRLGVVSGLFLLLIMGGLLIPVAHSTYAEGIVNLPENALIRAGTSGIISRVQFADGEQIAAGETVLSLENLELATQQDILLAQLEESRSKQREVLLTDRSQAETYKAKVLAIEAELKDVRAQLNSLLVTSPTHGVLSLPLVDDLTGKFIKRGEVLGYVADLKQVTARVVISQSAIDMVRSDTQSIEVRLQSRPGEVISATFLREIPQATNRLPSRSLGSGSGGDIAVDQRDADGVQALSNIFQVEIALPARQSGNYLGQRVYVRFIHPSESLVWRLKRKVAQFLSHTQII